MLYKKTKAKDYRPWTSREESLLVDFYGIHSNRKLGSAKTMPNGDLSYHSVFATYLINHYQEN